MRARQLTWLAIFFVSALALVTASAAGGAGASTQRASDQSWTDPAGDAVGGAPDLTAVTVSNDAAGTITMNVTVPMVANTMLMVIMDTNLNGRIDDSMDCVIGAIGNGPGTVVVIPTLGNVIGASIPSLRWSSTTTSVTFSIAKSDLAIGQGFAFAVATDASSNSGSDFGDEMPDGLRSLYVYLLTTPPPPTPTPTPAPSAYKPVIGAPMTTPARAVAGKRFTVTFPVTRSDTGAPLTTGKMVCDPSVAGKVLVHAESFKGGNAKLSFVIPKTAKGKLLKVKVTIKAGAKPATKVATFRVK